MKSPIHEATEIAKRDLSILLRPGGSTDLSARRVYLAGPINGMDDAACKPWRTEIAKRLLERYGIPSLDPMRRDYRGRELEPGAFLRIVEDDLADVRSCAAVLAWCPVPSVGTSMELLYAAQRGKWVAIVVPPGARISPWLLYCADALFENLDAAADWLGATIEKPLDRSDQSE
jgi:hypothetical protein